MRKDIPANYVWLTKEPGPRMLLEALKLYGVSEVPGPGNSPEIMSWKAELPADIQKAYTGDQLAWCGYFLAVVAKRAGKPLPEKPLWARDWLNWGVRSYRESLGDVLVFSRAGGGGHVGLYVGEDGVCYHVLGGNQGDAVSIVRIAKGRLLGARRHYSIGPPANVRPVFLAASGAVSRNEA